jgi:imidazolonepropionase-like amidohydrolase
MINEKDYVLTGVTIIDGTGSEPEPNMAVTVKDGAIAKIENMDTLKVPSGIEAVDLNGLFLLPGLIDAHVHLAGVIEWTAGGLIETNLITKALLSVGEAQAVLKRGFTSVREVSPTGLYLKRVIHAGKLLGPRIVAVGGGLCATGGAGDSGVLPPAFIDAIKAENNGAIICDGDTEIRKAVRMLLREGADQIKFFATGAGGSPVDKDTDRQYSLEEMKLIVSEAKKFRGTKVLAHVLDLETAWMCMEAGVDSFEHIGAYTEELFDKMAEEGKFLVPTINLIVNWLELTEGEGEELLFTTTLPPFYHRDEGVDFELEGMRQFIVSVFQMAHEKGVKIALGSDLVDETRTPPGEYNIQELKAMVEFGMTPLEGIRAATQVGSELLGLDHRIGTIEEGKLADLIVVEGDPSSNIDVLMDPKNLKYVIQSGKTVVDHGKITI